MDVVEELEVVDVVSHDVEVTELVVGVSGDLEVVGLYEVDVSYLVKSKPRM